MRTLSILLLLSTAACHATTSTRAPGHHAPSPYVHEAGRSLKALSPAEVAAYRGGEGMGLAKAAELNGYPGPRHVLDLADTLGLTAAQRDLARTAFDEMHAAAVRLGGQIVARERTLDSLFASGGIDEQTLRATVASISALQGELRYVHLRAHLELTGALTPEQRMRYNHLRGYGHHHGS